MDVMQEIRNCGIVPVVVIDKAEDAVPTAKALAAGGVNVMEITLRTAAGLDAIRQVAKHCPDVLVGAGTVITLNQCKHAVEAGAKFIVSPGFDRNVVAWCVENNVDITPGCVTPTEIIQAMELGINVIKFFPANIYGGLSAMKALAGPFPGIKFIPTGGISEKNLDEYIKPSFIHAVGGSWLCTRADIAAGNFDKIEALAKSTVNTMLGFEWGHIGINNDNKDESMSICNFFDKAFGTGIQIGELSNFVSPAVEVLNFRFLGEHGHIAIKTNCIHRAMASLKKRGFTFDMSTAKYVDDELVVVYFTEHQGGFAVHLLQA